MATNPYLQEFRKQAQEKREATCWVTQAQQDEALERLLDDAAAVRQAGLGPTVCIDLDLTTLLAPEKSRNVLKQLAAQPGVNFPPRCAAMNDALARVWRGEKLALLPGYTSTSITAYGEYLAIWLEAETGFSLEDDRASVAASIAASVHNVLRNGYWDRDLSRDEYSPGFAAYAARLVEAGATIVFLSNRDPKFRDVSIASLTGLLGGAAPLFAFFGPGGSAFDASSKAVAIERIEAGAAPGLWLGRAVNGKTVFDAPRTEPASAPQAVIAVVDDRAENRRQILEAAKLSSSLLAAAGLSPPREIASAPIAFCPEIETVGAPYAISSFCAEGAE